MGTLRSALATITQPGLATILQQHHIPAWRAKQIIDWRNRGVIDPHAMHNLPATLQEQLVCWLNCTPLTVINTQQSIDGTRKYLLQLTSGSNRGKLIESVFIPETERGTICISSQVGCPLECPFCCTGSQPFDGNLTGDEIVSQILLVMDDLRHHPPDADLCSRATHIVFMGMGEPMSNQQGVHAALSTILNELTISRRRVTISTSGLVHGIKRLGDAYPVNLAISLHAALDPLRDQLVPINRTFPLAELRTALDQFPLAAQRHITLEYVMLAGVNDRDEDIEALTAFVNKQRERVNLIRYNPHPASDFTGSSAEKIDRFAHALTANKIRTTVRRSRGDDIMAACGQLKSSN
ncbi:MAG: 23S rRNA (adenine(2503)-C(2))-methyltransferase RlmN, partial [Mariprofundales bacterium]|nr:23S rRNA (adenine(2503)-C(2))-methyltransferase RlmN [Mariprofundales bacterium]